MNKREELKNTIKEEAKAEIQQELKCLQSKLNYLEGKERAWEWLNKNRVKLFIRFHADSNIKTFVFFNGEEVGFWVQAESESRQQFIDTRNIHSTRLQSLEVVRDDYSPFYSVPSTQRSGDFYALPSILIKDLLRRKVDFAEGKFGSLDHIVAKDR